MKKFFAQRIVVQSDINKSTIAKYRQDLMIEMKKMGASKNELLLVHDATIINSIQNKRKPEDVAWAILQ